MEDFFTLSSRQPNGAGASSEEAISNLKRRGFDTETHEI